MVDTRLNWSYRYEGYYNSNIVHIKAFMRLCINNDKTDIVAVVNAGSGQWEGLKCCWKVSLVIAGWIIMFVCSEQEWICLSSVLLTTCKCKSTQKTFTQSSAYVTPFINIELSHRENWWSYQGFLDNMSTVTTLNPTLVSRVCTCSSK